MGFWPFGRDPANIDLASRVVTAVARDGVKVRGKLTVHFLEPQRQSDADETLDRIATTTEQVLREGPSSELLGGEPQIVAAVAGRLPAALAETRAIELAALHCVGDTATGSRPMADLVGNLGLAAQARAELGLRPPQSVRPAPPPPPPESAPPRPPSAPPMSLPNIPSLAVGRNESGRPPDSAPPSAPGSQPPPPAVAPGSRRPSSGWMRAIAADMVLPPTTPPRMMGAAIGQVVRDLAGRLLIGTLRAHDVLARGLALDDESAETLAALVPLSDAPPGGYEASRAAEIGRWEVALGDEVVSALRREVNIASTYLAYLALQRSGIPQQAAVEALEGICMAAFPKGPSPAVDLGRYLHAVEPTVVEELAHNVVKIVGGEGRSSDMGAALAPLLATITEDMALAASIIKRSLDG